MAEPIKIFNWIVGVGLTVIIAVLMISVISFLFNSQNDLGVLAGMILVVVSLGGVVALLAKKFPLH